MAGGGSWPDIFNGAKQVDSLCYIAIDGGNDNLVTADFIHPPEPFADFDYLTDGYQFRLRTHNYSRHLSSLMKDPGIL